MKSKILLQEVFNLKDFLFPKNCLNCQKEGYWICKNCSDSLFFLKNNFCFFCGTISNNPGSCLRCKKILGIENIFSLFSYSDFLVQDIIKAFKYSYIKEIINDLEMHFRKFVFKYKFLINKNATIIPIPLHYYKKNERGFNQAEIIANLFGSILNLEVKDNILKKNKVTKNQAKLDYKQRLSNLDNAFKVINKVPRDIIIVDDVFTTGSTVLEVVRVLKNKGAENAQVITLAKG